ncbi:S-adenosylmethionine decarboxylase [Myriangium duriaei CBS 260.36]|uniref:adenosylmethionine decarboxylase n=1 Tax=Myriangium duriaei CBS 260.36 TaxID=1168546 RepID=A0A9P4MHI6_9PEZI|nr:S-adenosylmethionine decarboxylase [Myriangium duriaei CBS 260.36]
MVNIEIPTHYTGSPSSLSGTPFLTINKDATECLDSSNAFEGPEKLLEVWFSPSANALPVTAQPNGLKAVSGETWKEMLDLVNCQVLSTIESEHVDAYLLSESSMFVFPHKLVLKTCGTTTLLLGLPRMLEIAATEAGFPAAPGKATNSAYPYRVFYSRKNFLFPDKQTGPHRSWRDEVRYLDKQFPGGSAYMIGKMNGEHWYLYITSPNMELTPPLTPDEEKNNALDQHAAENGLNLGDMRQLAIDPVSDETLEILMTDLEEGNARQFYVEDATRILQGDSQRQAHEARLNGVDHLDQIPEKKRADFQAESDATFDVFAKQSLELPSDDASVKPVSDNNVDMSEGHLLGQAVSDNCGLSDVYPVSKYPDARIDAYLFTPCGFSANGVVPSPNDPASTHYFNVHVTPEPVCSYASFETNVPARQSGRETSDVVAQVVEIFKPGRFSVTLFEAKSEEDGKTKLKKNSRMDEFPGYKRVDRVLHDLEGYELVFRHFERHGFKGGRPRIGTE